MMLCLVQERDDGEPAHKRPRRMWMRVSAAANNNTIKNMNCYFIIIIYLLCHNEKYRRRAMSEDGCAGC